MAILKTMRQVAKEDGTIVDYLNGRQLHPRHRHRGRPQGLGAARDLQLLVLDIRLVTQVHCGDMGQRERPWAQDQLAYPVVGTQTINRTEHLLSDDLHRFGVRILRHNREHEGAILHWGTHP